MQAASYTHVQLTLPPSKNELSMYLVGHFASEPLATPTIDLFKFSLATVIAFISIAQLLLNLGDTLLALCRTDTWCCYSIDELFSTMDQVFLDLVPASTLAWVGPFQTALIAKLGTTTANFSSVSSVVGNEDQDKAAHTSYDCTPTQWQPLRGKRSNVAIHFRIPALELPVSPERAAIILALYGKTG